MDPSAKPLRVLGIDPGTHVCGWGVVEGRGARLTAIGYGTVRAPAAAPIERRLAVIARELRDVVARYAPASAAIEEAFFGRDVRAAIRIGEGRGAALVVLAEAGLDVTGYANNVVKRAVAGAGRAGKTSVHAMTKAILGLATITGPLDASDALALAICHHHALAAGAAAGRAAPAGRLAPRIEAAIAAQRAADLAKDRAVRLARRAAP